MSIATPTFFGSTFAWKKIFHANGNQKKAGVAKLISDKIDFKLENVTRDRKDNT